MKASKEAVRVARLLLDSVREKGVVVPERVGSLLAAVREKSPAGAAQALQRFHKLVRLELEKRSATIESAAELSEPERASFETALRAKVGSDLLVRFSVNPELIAGVRIRIGDDVFDSNVRERLARLKLELAR